MQKDNNVNIDDVGNETVNDNKTVSKAKTKTTTSTKTNELVKSQDSDVVLSSTNISSLNLLNDRDLIAAENFLLKVMRSDKSGIKSVNDGLAILMRAQDLNLPFSTCIEHIHVINGKTGVDVHIIKALLLRAGCTWQVINDYQPLYEYTDGFNVYIDNSLPSYSKKCINQEEANRLNAESEDIIHMYPVKWYKDINGNVYRDYQLNTTKFGIATNKQDVTSITKAGKIPVYRIPNTPVDYLTEYEFTRVINGKTIKTTSKFTYSEAKAAELLEKDNYLKYTKVLIGHRAFTYGARDIASDIIFGSMETSELKIMNNIPLNNKDLEDIEYEDIL